MKTVTKNKKWGIGLAILVVLAVTNAYAHDGWIQTNVARVSQGDMVYLDMQFGNHGNMHRDYKIYPSKWNLDKGIFLLHTPDGDVVDLKESVIDVGADVTQTFADGVITYIDKNGYLVASFPAQQKGYYIADVGQDMVVSYAPERSIKCTKAIVASVPVTQGNFGKSMRGFDAVLGQDLEIIPQNDPTNLAVGDTLTFQVLFKGEPLVDAEVSVIPRGKTLPPMGEPNPYDLMTDMNGMVSFTFEEANYHLIVVHHDTDEAGTLDSKVYTMTKYAAALTTIVRPAAIKKVTKKGS